MKTTKRKAASRRRNLFAEISDGFAALREAREGKRTLRTHEVESKPVPEVTPGELVRLREQYHLSRKLFASCLRTNARTLENWEQGRAKPNAQAALLIGLVRKYPDMITRLNEL
ncbi:MAG: transcriptional regulator [Deltaproteobacteria bacterium]|nr:transcriptional regulator [Deltaproteobacteria bacterium]